MTPHLAAAVAQGAAVLQGAVLHVVLSPSTPFANNSTERDL